MTERATVVQGVQLGVETVPGDGTAANILVNSFTIEPGVKVNMQKFRPTGQKVDSIIVPGKEWVEAKLTGLGSYSEMQYLLASVLGPGQVSQPSALDGAELWKFLMKAREQDTLQTYSFEQGDSTRAHKFAYGLLQELDLTFTRDSIAVGGTLFAQRLTDDVTLTADPVAAPEVPMLPQEVSVYLDTAFGSLGSTKLERAFKATFKLASRTGQVWTLDSANDSFATHVETVPGITLSLLMEADDVGMANLGHMREGDSLFARVEAISDTLASVGPDHPYSFKLDGAYKISNVQPFADEQGVYAVEWELSTVYDPGSELALAAELVNKEISLAPPLT